MLMGFILIIVEMKLTAPRIDNTPTVYPRIGDDMMMMVCCISD